MDWIKVYAGKHLKVGWLLEIKSLACLVSVGFYSVYHVSMDCAFNTNLKVLFSRGENLSKSVKI